MKIIVLFVVENIQNSRQRPEASADPSTYQITDSSLPNVEHRTDGKYFSYYMNFMNFNCLILHTILRFFYRNIELNCIQKLHNYIHVPFYKLFRIF